MSDIFDDIKRDQKSNTSGFHWIGETLMAKEFGEVVELCNVDWSGLDEFEAEHKARIARVPQLERIALAAEELAAAVEDDTGSFEDAQRIARAHMSFLDACK